MSVAGLLDGDDKPSLLFNGSCRHAHDTDCVLPNGTASAIAIAWSAEQLLVLAVLAVLNVAIVVGNLLVILSVCIFKRMRTFTNVLLVSLATSDALVGVLVTPFSAMDLLLEHRWYFGRVVCGVWATSDVLLCTASILNLCVISIDRYFAITTPLHYSRRRTANLGACLLTCVWLLSVLICLPPWLVPAWDMFAKYKQLLGQARYDQRRVVFMCAYSRSIAYRIYSASGSFYLPLIVMLFVYWRIFRVANEREKSMTGDRGNNMRFTIRKSIRRYYKSDARNSGSNEVASDRLMEGAASADAAQPSSTTPNGTCEQHVDRQRQQRDRRKSTFAEVAPHIRKAPSNLIAHARHMYDNGMATKSKPHREKVVYARERKALKTIGMIVFGFIICWLPFFVLYLIDVLFTLSEQYVWLFDLFLWLGYSNSALNPIIYTFFNGDFRRCFRDLLKFGPCCRRIGAQPQSEAKFSMQQKISTSAFRTGPMYQTQQSSRSPRPHSRASLGCATPVTIGRSTDVRPMRTIDSNPSDDDTNQQFSQKPSGEPEPVAVAAAGSSSSGAQAPAPPPPPPVARRSSVIGQVHTTMLTIRRQPSFIGALVANC